LSVDYPGFVNGQYVGIIISLQGGSTDTLFYGPLYRHATYRPVFREPTTMYAGQMALNTQYGSPQLHRSVNGVTWELASVPFKPWEIELIAEQGYVLLREPNSGYIIDTIRVGTPVSYPSIIRMVTVPEIADATTIPAVGVYYVPSNENFILTVIPNPNSPRANVTPLLTTNRKLIADAEGVSLSSMRDGSYTFTIYSIQEPVRISIEFPSPANTGTASDVAVWAAGQQLHIVASEPGTAVVYTLMGTAFKTVPLSEGRTTTVTSLPAGIYIISIKGENYKVWINRQ
jgi:hypothetical protein